MVPRTDLQVRVEGPKLELGFMWRRRTMNNLHTREPVKAGNIDLAPTRLLLKVGEHSGASGLTLTFASRV